MASNGLSTPTATKQRVYLFFRLTELASEDSWMVIHSQHDQKPLRDHGNVVFLPTVRERESK